MHAWNPPAPVYDSLCSQWDTQSRARLKSAYPALHAQDCDPLYVAVTALQAMQKVMGNAMAACTLLNVGTVLSVSALEVAASASFIAAGFFGIATLINFLKVRLCLYGTATSGSASADKGGACRSSGICVITHCRSHAARRCCTNSLHSSMRGIVPRCTQHADRHLSDACNVSAGEKLEAERGAAVRWPVCVRRLSSICAGAGNLPLTKFQSQAGLINLQESWSSHGCQQMMQFSQNYRALSIAIGCLLEISVHKP